MINKKHIEFIRWKNKGDRSTSFICGVPVKEDKNFVCMSSAFGDGNSQTKIKIKSILERKSTLSMPIELICWSVENKQKLIAGFVIQEQHEFIEIASTLGSRGFCDVAKIQNESIVYRKRLSTTRKKLQDWIK